MQSSELTKGLARHLRQRSTEAEKKLWSMLRTRRFDGFKFRRQVPIGRYIADFVCFEQRLIVELDGSHHAGSTRDAIRDRWFTDDGYRMLRVWNNELNDNRNGVLEAVWPALQAYQEQATGENA